MAQGGRASVVPDPVMMAPTSERRSRSQQPTNQGGSRRTSQKEPFCSACSPRDRGQQDRVRGDVRARLCSGLKAPVNNRPATRHPPPDLWTTRTRLHFHHTGCRISDINDSVENLLTLSDVVYVWILPAHYQIPLGGGTYHFRVGWRSSPSPERGSLRTETTPAPPRSHRRRVRTDRAVLPRSRPRRPARPPPRRPSPAGPPGRPACRCRRSAPPGGSEISDTDKPGGRSPGPAGPSMSETRAPRGSEISDTRRGLRPTARRTPARSGGGPDEASRSGARAESAAAGRRRPRRD
jgi:hypothetical protein